MIDLDQHLETASLPEEVVPVCLRGDLLTALHDAQVTADTLALGETQSIARSQAQQALQEAREAVRAASLSFRLRGLPDHLWTSLVTKHSEANGGSVAALQGAVVRASLIDPEPSNEQWERLRSVLTSGQVELLSDAAVRLSREVHTIPFSLAAYARTSSSAPKSKRQPG